MLDSYEIPEYRINELEKELSEPISFPCFHRGAIHVNEDGLLTCGNCDYTFKEQETIC